MKHLITLTSLLIILPGTLSGQEEKIGVSDPRLELRGSTLFIHYDILDTEPTELFDVELRITDPEGNSIPARSLKGDIGSGVAGGTGKQISWNLQADQVSIRSRILVQVLVERVPSPVQNEEPSELKAERSVEDQDMEQNPVRNPSRRITLLAQSAVLPGWGLTRITGKPHWIKGVAAYGCMAGSVYLNRQAIESSSGITDLEDFDAKSDLYRQAQRQDNLSEILAYGAAAIWAADIIWTLVATSGGRSMAVADPGKGFLFQAGIQPMSAVPTAGFVYKF